MLLVLLFTALLSLLVLSAFFSSAETAFFSLNPTRIHRIRRHHPKVAAAVEQLLAVPTRLLSTILIGNTVVNVAASGVGYAIAHRLVPAHGETVAIAAMTVLIILFGEVAPKRMAVRRPEWLAMQYAAPLQTLVRASSPARWMLERIADRFSKSLQPFKPLLTGAELLTAVEVSHEEGILSEEERIMVDGIIRLEKLEAKDVMTPRVDVVGIDLNASPETQADVARRSRRHYLPVYRGSLDHVEGFLDVPRFLLAPVPNLKAAMFPHFYVPDTASLDTLITIFQQQDRRVAVVIDEFGGSAGLITRDDILDEIVDVEEREGDRLRIEPAGLNRWLVDGAVSLEDINYELDLHLDAEGADRIAGWFTAQTGRIPKVGDVVETPQCRATVIRMKQHRITTLEIEKSNHAEKPDAVE